MIYFVSTPIGNLKDITLRALDVLKEADVIACEDTRTSKTLLDHYGIKPEKLISYHKFNEQESSDKIIELNNLGKNIAVISDAGTPIISDPGNILNKKLCDKNIPFSVVPGANALLPALVLSGFDANKFYFAGFLPEKLLSQVISLSCSLIFYISPHSLLADLNYLYAQLGARKACLVKELTKIFETRYEFVLGEEININTKGEFVLIIEGKQEENLDDLSIFDHVSFYINLGMTKNDAIKKVAKERGLAKNEVYKEVLNISSNRI